MAFKREESKREAFALERKQFSQWKAKNVKQGKAYRFYVASIMTHGKRCTNKG
ncbi:hypothetical protein H1230_18785 [Paenibacillus sp. 19GGS1-52]|uniref:hypothetical protein n=1 Tax=Paenibacillus sp. 19GGS1-52 TaxID=2758563 RepID=UPI001EFB7248|nr:hypothetical protein [Paenibacillus sp. 19GGS1-52]ULO05157.1 hypothetical protein H1230_18785 [Paenibacillus sp. 19GGS1-52]